jgi:LemA protein
MGLVLVAGIAVAIYAIWMFNRLTQLRQLSDNAWADIDVQLKRRHDLIPTVVAVVKGHAGYERSTLEGVVNARNRALEASGPAARAEAEDPVAGSLRRIFAIAEAYPDLRATASFRELQLTLSDVEDHLQNARRYYNAVVRDLNTRIAQFPSSVVAGLLRFRPREFFGLDDTSERAVPQVDVGAGE